MCNRCEAIGQENTKHQSPQTRADQQSAAVEIAVYARHGKQDQKARTSFSVSTPKSLLTQPAAR